MKTESREMQFPEGLKVELALPMFPANTAPMGFLTRDIACQACWYYYTLAQRLYEQTRGGLENQIIEYKVGDAAPLWLDAYYYPIARTVEQLYGVSLNDIFHYWRNVRMEAARTGNPIPHDDYVDPSRERPV